MVCGFRSWTPTGPIGALAARLALAIQTAAPGSVNVQALVPGRVAEMLRERAARKDVAARWAAVREKLRAFVPQVLDHVVSTIAARQALVWLLWAIGDRAFTAQTAATLFVGGSLDPEPYRTGSDLRDLARLLLLLAGEAAAPHVAEFRRWPLDRERSYNYLAQSKSTWGQFDERAETAAKGAKVWDGNTGWSVEKGKLTFRDSDNNGVESGHVRAAVLALNALVGVGQQQRSEKCGELLYQAHADSDGFRRVPLAKYIVRRYRRQIRSGPFAFVADEMQEYAAENSAQALAWKRLMCLRIPTICMTGSVMNGYADSMFSLLWYTNATFREEFDRGDRPDFVRTYGYVKRFVEQKDGEGKPVVFGTYTDRVETSFRESGQAPGALPTLYLRYLLPRAVTLQMADIEGELPPAREIPVMVKADGELGERYRRVERTLIAQMKRDKWDKDLAGKLFGQLAELPSSLDRMVADVVGPEYRVVYPQSAGTSAGRLVVSVDSLPADTVLPKERAMLDILERELAEGRNVVVFPWHVDLIPRLVRLASPLGRVAVLDCNKVAPLKRDAWIEREVSRKTRAIVVNPVGVSTGINSMVPYFSTDIWYENPACNPMILRQGRGRTRRIGQDKEKRSYVLTYEGTSQEVAYRLLLHKVGIGEAADGLDATAALQAAGVGTTDALVAQDIGRALFDALTREPSPGRAA
jgi:hypothetical protein